RADRAQKVGARPLSAEERAHYPHRSETELDRAVMMPGGVHFPKRQRSAQGPSAGWREVGENEALPPGSHVRMDLATGKNYVRVDPSTAQQQAAPGGAATPISAEEREHYRKLGYSDEEISAAKRLGKTGPLLIRPTAARKTESPPVAAARRKL